ncbi:MAG TPA: O-antigen translocase [Chitinophagaceae bacterium]|nr:O-antigen translocase [Chitinophagaceae bacterium]
MLAKVKKLAATDLVKVSSLNAVSVFIKMIASFISIKVVASNIGPRGIALLGQLNNFSAILLSISTGGINSGVTRYVAEHKAEPSKAAVFVRTGFWITVALSLVTGIILILGAGYFSTLILKDVSYTSIFIVFGFTIIMYALNTYLLSVINGRKEFRLYVIVNITSSICGLIFSVILAIQFGTYGALIAAVTFQSVVFLLTLLILARKEWFTWTLFTGRYSKDAALKLGHYSVMELVSAATVPVSQLILRDYIVGHEDIVNAGLWTAMNQVSGMYLLVVTASLGVYFLPRMAELKTQRELRTEIVHTYKIILPALFVMLAMIFLFRNTIMHLVFSSKFEGMQDLFLYQLIGDFFKIAGWILACQLVAKAMTRTYIITEIGNRAFFVGVGILFVNNYGTIGATIAYAIVCFLYFLVMVFIFRKMLFSRQ